MDQQFAAIVERLVREQGKAVMLDAAKCKSLLNDYTKNEYKKERHLLLLAIEIGAAKEIANAPDVAIAKKVQIRISKDDHFIDEAAAVGIVDLLGLVLRGDRSVSAGARAVQTPSYTPPNYSQQQSYTPPAPSYTPPPKQPPRTYIPPPQQTPVSSGKKTQPQKSLFRSFIGFLGKLIGAICIIIITLIIFSIVVNIKDKFKSKSSTKQQDNSYQTPSKTYQPPRYNPPNYNIQEERRNALWNKAYNAFQLEMYSLFAQYFTDYITKYPNDAAGYLGRCVSYRMLGWDMLANSDGIEACARGNCDCL